MIPRAVPNIPMEVRTVQEILTKLGDYSSLEEDDDIIQNIYELSNVLIEVGDLKRFPEEISAVFVNCFRQLSMQVPILASLLMLLAEKEKDFVELVVRNIQTKLLEVLENDEVLTAKLFLRTVSSLASAGCFAVEESGGLLEIFENLLQGTISGGSLQELSEQSLVCAYLLASSIPWSIEALLRFESGKDFLKRLHECLAEIKNSWNCPFDLNDKQSVLAHTLPGTLVASSMEEKPTPLVIFDGISDSFTELLHVAIHFLDLYSNFDVSKSVLEFPEVFAMPWKQFKERSLLSEELVSYLTVNQLRFTSKFQEEIGSLFEQQLIGKTFRANYSSRKDSGLSFCLGEKFLSEKNSAFIHCRLSLFNSETNDDCFPCCQLSMVEKFLVVSYLEDILNYFDIVVNEDGTKLGSLELLISHLLAVSKLFSINNDSSAPTKLAIEYFLVEVLFHKLVALPINRRTNNLIIYRLLLQLCKRNSSFPPMIALATNILFLILPSLRVQVIMELANWFSFHFVNTLLKWPFWDFWIGEVGLLKEENKDQEEEEDPVDHSMQLFFIRAVVQRCSELVSTEKLDLVIPNEFKQFLENNRNSPLLLVESSEDLPCNQLKAMIEQRNTPEKIIDFIESVPIFVNQVFFFLLSRLYRFSFFNHLLVRQIIKSLLKVSFSQFPGYFSRVKHSPL
jgi:hypothetical protein